MDIAWVSADVDHMGHRPRKSVSRSHAIRAWRELRGLTIEQLANQIDVSIASLSRIETGKQPYSQSLIEALAAALRCEPADLIVRRPTSQPMLELQSFIKELSDDECRQAIRVLSAIGKPAAIKVA